MEIKISSEKSLYDNISSYYDASKKAKNKLSNMEKLIEAARKDLEKKINEKEVKKESLQKKQKMEWFEKFHWFYTSNNFLVISGRDKKSIETVVKKHLEKEDIYFHSEIVGAAHTIVKNGIKAEKEDLEEAAVFAGIFSKAWTTGLHNIDVYSVNAEQVSKSAPSGQSIGTGEFMIYGKRKYFKNVSLNFAVGIQIEKDSYKIISGPVSSVKKHCKVLRELIQGPSIKSISAKKLQFLFSKESGIRPSIDELIRMIPEKTTISP